MSQRNLPTSDVTTVEAETPTHTDAKHPSSAQAEYIYVSDDFKVKEGAKLAEDLFVGKPLGVGLQGGVFLLQNAAGRTDPNQVLKAVFKFGIGGLFGMTNLEREWRVGRQLSLLTNPGEALPGFMGTGSGVITKSGKFRAMILERIVGRDVTKPVGDVKFHDVHYLRQMLFCTFKSLHQAQRKLAFHHADLRLANIMELMPAQEDKIVSPLSSSTNSGRIQDTAHHDASFVAAGGHDNPAVHAPTSLTEAASQPYLSATPILQQQPQAGPPPTQAGAPTSNGTTAQAAANLQSASMEADTIQANDLPHVYDTAAQPPKGSSSNTPFKMIDFGLADFRETFGAGYVTGKKGKLIHNEPHHLEPLRSTAGKDAASLQPNAPAPEHKTEQGFSLSVLRGGNKGIEHRSDAVPAGSKSTKFFPTPSDLLPQVPPVERLYRYFWRRKGDVYALLWDMQRYIDGRVWPDRDELEVRLMMDLFKHVTGVHVKAWFAPLDESDTSGDLALRDEKSFHACGCIYRNDGWAHWLRIRSLRIRSFLRPDNPGITAAEALTAPFFTYDQQQGFFLDA